MLVSVNSASAAALLDASATKAAALAAAAPLVTSIPELGAALAIPSGKAGHDFGLAAVAAFQKQLQAERTQTRRARLAPAQIALNTPIRATSFTLLEHFIAGVFNV